MLTTLLPTGDNIRVRVTKRRENFIERNKNNPLVRFGETFAYGQGRRITVRQNFKSKHAPRTGLAADLGHYNHPPVNHMIDQDHSKKGNQSCKASGNRTQSAPQPDRNETLADPGVILHDHAYTCKSAKRFPNHILPTIKVWAPDALGKCPPRLSQEYPSRLIMGMEGDLREAWKHSLGHPMAPPTTYQLSIKYWSHKPSFCHTMASGRPPDTAEKIPARTQNDHDYL